MAKQSPPTAAVIDIGSSELRLHIAQAHTADDAETVKYLESLSYPLALGRDTFHAGKMSFDKVDKACDVIKNFLQAARAYGVRNIRTVASTAVREAANMDYMLDQIKIKTGVTVAVTDDLEEKQYIYKLLSHYASDPIKQSALMVYIGTGNIGVSLFEGGRIPCTWNIRAGSLRIGEMFGPLQEYTSGFYRLMEEYLAGFMHQLRAELPTDKSGVGHLIVSGTEIDMMTKMVLPQAAAPHSAPLFDIPRDAFLSFYESIKRKTPERIAQEFGLSGDMADALLPAACIYQHLLALTRAPAITVSRLLPCDAMLFESLYPKRFSAIEKRFARSAELCAARLAARYGKGGHHDPHEDCVRGYALTIFDKMKKRHGLGSRDKLLLNLAATLHEIGEYLNYREHYLHSYDMVRASDMVGLSHAEIEIVALLCRYHSRLVPHATDAPYRRLPADAKVRVSKLAAMLRLADALDRSHKQKFPAIEVKLTDTALICQVNTHANVSLEQWAFADKRAFFEEVFGLKAQLKVKKL